MSLFEKTLTEKTKQYTTSSHAVKDHSVNYNSFANIFTLYEQTGEIKRSDILEEDDPMEWLPSQYRPSQGGDPLSAPADVQKDAVENFCLNNPHDPRCAGGRTEDWFKSANAGQQSPGIIRQAMPDLPGAVGAQPPAPQVPKPEPEEVAAPEPEPEPEEVVAPEPAVAEQPPVEAPAPVQNSEPRKMGTEYDLSGGNDFFSHKSHMLAGRPGSRQPSQPSRFGQVARGAASGLLNAPGNIMRGVGRGAGAVTRGAGHVANSFGRGLRGVATAPYNLAGGARDAYIGANNWAAKKERDTKELGAFGALPDRTGSSPNRTDTNPKKNRYTDEREDFAFKRWEAQKNGDPTFTYRGNTYKTTSGGQPSRIN